MNLFMVLIRGCVWVERKCGAVKKFERKLSDSWSAGEMIRLGNCVNETKSGELICYSYQKKKTVIARCNIWFREENSYITSE